MMYPFLYEASERDFLDNGIGSLSDCLSCIVTEEMNGIFELKMTYPIDGLLFNEIILRNIIYAKPSHTVGYQPFRIYKISKPMSGVVTINARHITYDLSGVPVAPFTADNSVDAANALIINSQVNNLFTFTTDITENITVTSSIPQSFRTLMGNLLAVYGGEYGYDGFSVYLYASRGQDRGVTLRYGKNITSLQQDANCEAVYTGIFPYWYKEGFPIITLSQGVVSTNSGYDFNNVLVVDFTKNFNDPPTEADLQQIAEDYIANNNLSTPSVSLTVRYEQDSEFLEQVDLCDYVTVYFPKLNVDVKAQIVEVEYDVLKDRYVSVSLGSARINIADTIAKQNTEIEKTFPSYVQSAIAQVTGNVGGYVVLHNSHGGNYPNELLIMDADKIEDATNVWRFNNGGLAHSKNGYNSANYDIAITQDGVINADFIKAGRLDANLIYSGDEKLTDYVQITAGQIVLGSAQDASAKTIITASRYVVTNVDRVQFGNYAFYKPDGEVMSFGLAPTDAEGVVNI